MYRSDLSVCRLFGLAALLLALTVAPASAQDAATVMDDARDRMMKMFENVEHYKTVTESFTTYTRKVERNGDVEFESATSMAGSSQAMGGTVSSPFSQYDGIGKHGKLVGSETVNGIDCHAIKVDDPGKIDPQMSSAESITYYIGKGDYLVHRMVMDGMKQGRGQSDMSMTMDMEGYQDYGEGLMFPSQMVMKMSGIDPEVKKQMEEMKERMKQMPEAQRKRMQKMMDQAGGMMSGEPTVIEVKEVEVNGDLPEGIFDN